MTVQISFTKISLFLGIFFFFLFTQYVSAATFVSSATYPPNTNVGLINWTQEGSPYVIEDNIYLRYGSGIVIEPGVVVKFMPGATLTVPAQFPITIDGTPEEPVIFTSFKDDSVGGDTNNDGDATTPAPGDWGYASFGSGSWNNNMDLQHFKVQYGGGVSNPLFQDTNISPSLVLFFNWYSGSPGISYTLKNIEVSHSSDVGLYTHIGRNNILNISDSGFLNNVNYGVRKTTLFGSRNLDETGSMNLSGNWWGHESGPYHPDLNPGGTGNAIFGTKTSLDSWLSENPFSSFQYQECCSSVIFLPGLKGSELSIGSDKLWPPSLGSEISFTGDVQKLALDPHTRNSIYPVNVDGILNDFHGTAIYQGFTDFMNTLVTDDPGTGTSTIASWEAFPYDWRYGPQKVIIDENMITRLEAIASASETGEVTIVAHSMGGLVGKELIRQLEAQGKENLIDSYVMVGSPQLGTPQAMASLLHGDGEAIPGWLDGHFGIVVSPVDVREVAQNMPGAYSLLPSVQFFDAASLPTFIFDENAGYTQEWRNYWGPVIDKYLDFFSFITGGGVTRTEPFDFQLNIPEVLNPDLVTDAYSLHQALDSYIFPSNIRAVQVAGWGLPTTRAIEYVTNHSGYEIVPTWDGDKTVMTLSAVSSPAQTFFYNLALQNSSIPPYVSKYTHRDLLSSFSVQTLLQSVFKEQPIEETTLITAVHPSVSSLSDYLILRSDSPVLLGTYDELGNFTGVDPSQDLDAVILSVTEDIPGSYFTSSGESQSIFVPKVGKYRLVYQGIGSGPTTISTRLFSNDVVTPITVYSNIPTQENTQAELVVDSEFPEEAILLLDEDGDGNIDFFSKPDSYGRTLTDIVVDIREVALEMQTVRSNQSFKLNTYRNQINSRLDTIEQRYLNFLISEQNGGLFLSVSNLEDYINSISSGIARIRWTDSTELKVLLNELKDEVNYVETPGSGNEGNQDTSTGGGSVDTGEYYIDGDNWKVAL